MVFYNNTLTVGSLIDNRYVIESVLGKGGFGITYKAHHRGLDSTVVLKEYFPYDWANRASDGSTVEPHLNDVDNYQYGLARFLDEARVLAKFTHPNIVSVRDFTEANGTAYFTMDYAEGVTLDKWLEAQPKPVNETALLNIIIDILTGLVEIHKTGIIHRDIKPANIIIRTDARPLLIDFGSARYVLNKDNRGLTAVLTPGFSPPEQYTDSGQGPYTDLYALGATLYQIITHEKPIESTVRENYILKNKSDLMPAAVEAGKGKVSFWLLELIDELLSVKAGNRPQNAEDVLAAIQSERTVLFPVTNGSNDSAKQENTLLDKGDESTVIKLNQNDDEGAIMIFWFFISLLLRKEFWIFTVLLLYLYDKYFQDREITMYLLDKIIS